MTRADTGDPTLAVPHDISGLIACGSSSRSWTGRGAGDRSMLCSRMDAMEP
jgi:hypothetical protein